jgi:hypothetical protein
MRENEGEAGVVAGAEKVTVGGLVARDLVFAKLFESFPIPSPNCWFRKLGRALTPSANKSFFKDNRGSVPDIAENREVDRRLPFPPLVPAANELRLEWDIEEEREALEEHRFAMTGFLSFGTEADVGASKACTDAFTVALCALSVQRERRKGRAVRVRCSHYRIIRGMNERESGRSLKRMEGRMS